MLPPELGPWPDTSAAHAAVDLITAHEPVYLVHHSIRSYVYGRHFAQAQGLRPDVDYSDELHFLAAVLHDIGLTDQADGSQRFEVDGADRAAEFVRSQGFSQDDAEIVWDAVALHTSAGIADRKRPEIAFTHRGITADIFGLDAEHLDHNLVEAANRHLPRLALPTRLMADVARQVAANPAKFVPFTFVSGAVQYAAPHLSVPDTRAILSASHWADADSATA
ncbi:HD domain-containing protein [Streptomyces sp. NPDC026672]|uniref:HD domain-containing protein n=1 Tax=Streptomyces sp. NPDC026672 TaxID=3155252 RepID=UPI0033E76F3C